MSRNAKAVRSKSIRIGGLSVQPGMTRDIGLSVSETYTGRPVNLYVRVIRAKNPGPTVFLTGAVHGDELNGTGIIREIMLERPKLLNGSLILVPVTNIYGFENHSRYLPDRRDLNRCFPGSAQGSLTYRLADVVYNEIIKHSDYGIDLHSAPVRRTNFPQIRADLSVQGVQQLAHSFGCEFVIHDRPTEKTLRDAATEAGCPTILYEAGEALKFEPAMIKLGIRGVYNVLKFLKMIGGEPSQPTYQTTIQKTVWVRSETGGILEFHVRPGEAVNKGDKLATTVKMFGEQSSVIRSPKKGIVLGMTTLPAVKPGEAVCHVGITELSIEKMRSNIGARRKSLHSNAQSELATSFRVKSRKKTGRFPDR